MPSPTYGSRPNAIIDLDDDRVLVLSRHTARGKLSGAAYRARVRRSIPMPAVGLSRLTPDGDGFGDETQDQCPGGGRAVEWLPGSRRATARH